jgi:hypothetical protein
MMGIVIMGNVFKVCTLGGQDEDIEAKGIMIKLHLIFLKVAYKQILLSILVTCEMHPSRDKRR